MFYRLFHDSKNNKLISERKQTAFFKIFYLEYAIPISLPTAINAGVGGIHMVQTDRLLERHG